MKPYQIVTAPYEVWIAPAGSTAPAPGTAPTDPFVLLGTDGLNSYNDSGIALKFSRTLGTVTPAGSKLPIKAWSQSETATVGGSLYDLTVEQFAAVLDQATVTTVAAAAGVAGTVSIDLFDREVYEYSLLVRGVSPYGPDLTAQYVFSRVYQSADQTPTLSKQNPAELAFEFTVLGTVDGTDPGLYIAENEAATGV